MARDVRELHGAWTRFQRHGFPRPSRDLAAFVSHYWTVAWDYEQPYRQLVVPFPNVHLTFRRGVGQLTGVSSGHTYQVLAGRSSVFGVAFRPGCFRPFLGASVATLTDRVIPAEHVFPGEPPAPPTPRVEDVERFLRAHLPAPDPVAERMADAVELVANEPDIARVDVLAARLHTTVRTLQRLFGEYVGIGPKWVIRRYRLREVADRLTTTDLAAIAAELGYADQAHLTRDFTAMFGESPTRYRERY
jgi:AraC-like DNA-binding protein